MTSVLKAIGSLVWFGSSVYVIKENHYCFVHIEGMSMQPTLFEGDLTIAERISHNDLRIGDIIMFKSPCVQGQFIAKRLTGLPGDIKRSGFEFTEVPKGYMWVEGDNSKNSNDSRDFGPIPQGLTKYRLFYRFGFGPL